MSPEGYWLLGQASFPVIQTSVVLLCVMEGFDSAAIVSLRFFLRGVEAAEVVR